MNFISKLFSIIKNQNKEVKNDFDINIEDFNSTIEFWKFLTKENKWYIKYSPHKVKNIEKIISELEPLIVEETNTLRAKMEFNYDEYWKIIDWDNLLIRAEIDESNKFKRNKSINFKQVCSNCKKEKIFSQRYPKSICQECYSETTDLKNRKVEFFNTEALGSGCQGFYVGTEQKEKYNSDLCYITGKEFFAEEARFGGIVIQIKE